MSDLKKEILNEILSDTDKISKKPSEIVFAYYDVFSQLLEEGLSFPKIIQTMKDKRLIEKSIKTRSIYETFRRHRNKRKESIYKKPLKLEQPKKSDDEIIIQSKSDPVPEPAKTDADNDSSHIFIYNGQEIDFKYIDKLEKDLLPQAIKFLTINNQDDVFLIGRKYRAFLKTLYPLMSFRDVKAKLLEKALEDQFSSNHSTAADRFKEQYD